MKFLKTNYKYAIAFAAALFASACSTDAPTEVGDALITTGNVVTFEVILPASSFLQSDSAFTGYTKPSDANFTLLARKYGNTVDANSLFRFSLPPTTVIVRNVTMNTAQTDSAPRYFSGLMVLKFDTLTSPGAKPVLLRAFRTIEEWNESATWTNRIDTGTVHLPWSTPGGSRGVQIDTATWVAGDSVVFRVDSQTIATWRDTTNKARGAIVVAETNCARMRVLATAVHLSVHSTLRPDTVIAADVVPAIRTFVFNPQPAPTADLRVGGTPAWRSVLKLRPDLTSITVPCPGNVVGCVVALDSVHINSAQLLLKPKPSPAGFSLEDTSFIEVRPLATSTTVPLERSPVGGNVGLSKALAPGAFDNPVLGDFVRIDITPFFEHLTNTKLTAADRALLATALSLIQIPEPGTFGFMAFDQSPSLRLVLTAAVARQ